MSRIADNPSLPQPCNGWCSLCEMRTMNVVGAALIVLTASATAKPTLTKPSTAKPTRLNATNTCSLTEDKLFVHVLIEATYTKSSMGPMTSRDLWQFTCRRPDGDCEGVVLRLDNAEAGRKISVMDLSTLIGAKITSETGDLFVISWGPLRTFSVNLHEKSVTYVESNKTTYGTGRTPCEVLKS